MNPNALSDAASYVRQYGNIDMAPVNTQLLAEYGLAMREAQRLERRLRQVSLSHQLAMKLVHGKTVEVEDFNQALAEGNGKTMGKLFRRYAEALSALGAKPPPQADLDDVVQLRNFLAHHYFERQRYCDGQSPLPKVIRELPGNHLFTEEYLDNIQEPHPNAISEVRAALEQLQHHVRLLDDWLAGILDAMEIQP